MLIMNFDFLVSKKILLFTFLQKVGVMCFRPDPYGCNAPKTLHELHKEFDFKTSQEYDGIVMTVQIFVKFSCHKTMGL